MTADIAIGIGYVLACAMSLSVGIAAWRRRPAPGSFGLALLGFAQAQWSGAFALQWFLTDHGPSLLWLAVRNIGLFVSPIAVLMLILSYLGRDEWLSRRRVLLLSAVPILSYVALVSDPLHGLYLAGVEPTMKFGTTAPFFLLNLFYSYALMLYAVALLAKRLINRPPYPGQATVLLVAVLLPVVHFALQLAGLDLLPGVNTVPFTFAITGALNWYALTRLGLFRLIPIARDQLIEQLPVGVIVFDANRRIVDINPAARRLTGATADVRGMTSDEAFPHLMDTVTRLRGDLDAHGVATVRAEFSPGIHVEAVVTALTDALGTRIAFVSTLRDISNEVAAAHEIERRGEQLAGAYERTSRILSAMAEGVMLITQEGVLRLSNPALHRILGDGFTEGADVTAIAGATGIGILALAKEATDAGTAVTDLVETDDGRFLVVQAIPISTDASIGSETLFVIRDDTERHAAERMQRDFVANVAHELQTPLTGLSLLARTIPQAMLTDPRAVDGFVARLDGEVGRLITLTDQLMTLSRVERSLSPGEIPVTSVADIVAIETDAIEQLILDKGHTLRVDVPDGLSVRCGVDDLGTALGNLLRNAAYYTDPGGTITIDARSVSSATDGEWVEIIVSDTGIGVPPADLERIFERFYRVDKARSRRTGGAGIGLSIVKQVAERCGGSVSAESSPGQGSTFALRLPRA